MNTNKGLIEMIIIIIIALIILGYFGFNIGNVLSSPNVQANLSWAWNVVLTIWSYISAPIVWLWNTFVLGLIWPLLQAGIHQLQQVSTSTAAV